MIFLTLLIAPLFIAGISFVFVKGITWKEFLLQLGASVLVAAMSALIVGYSATADTEILNGSVTAKEQKRVSCSHSYRCNCRMVQHCTGSGKNRTCSYSEECDTCYEHAYDWDWDVYTTLGTYTIDRIDRRGSGEPPRWTTVQMGEPVSRSHGYTNYIKASPDTLFRHHGLTKQYASSLPKHPEVFDYYRMNRLVTAGIDLPAANAWNDALAKVSADIGKPKQANPLVVIVKNQPHEYFGALEQAWLGGKKNEVVLVVSVDDALTPQWTDVMAWSEDGMLRVKLRDAVMELPRLAPNEVAEAMRSNVTAHYRRKPMASFAYLESAIVPTTTEWIVSLLIGALVAIGLSWLFHKHDVFDEEGRLFA
jgi:hypothetical protein